MSRLPYYTKLRIQKRKKHKMGCRKTKVGQENTKENGNHSKIKSNENHPHNEQQWNPFKL